MSIFLVRLSPASRAVTRFVSSQAIAQPLDSLVRDIIIPPDLIYLIRDTTPGENWIPAIAQLEEKIRTVRSRGKVKASHEVGPIVEGLKTKVNRSIRCFQE